MSVSSQKGRLAEIMNLDRTGIFDRVDEDIGFLFYNSNHAPRYRVIGLLLTKRKIFEN